MWLERISGGGIDLIDLQDAKDYLRILGDETDSEVGASVAMASAFLDVDEDGFGGLGFPLVAQQWALKGSSFSADVLRMPFSRVATVDEIRFTSSDGQSGIVSPADYQLVKQGREWRVVLLSGKRWPALNVQLDAVEVRFTAGWPDVSTVPADIKSAARLLIGCFFGSRELSESEVPENVLKAVASLTGRYRRFAV